MVKRYDNAARAALTAVADEQLTPGVFPRSFEQDALEVSMTGEHIDPPIVDEIAPLIDQIVSGEIVVPAEVEQRALAPLDTTCPADGCQIRILQAEPSGSELALTLEANWILSTGARHAHYFWSPTYTAEQVGGDSAARFGVARGSWNLSDAYPVYVTAGAASLSERGADVDLCVTAADGNHNVIDPTLFDCISVADVVG